MNEVIPISQMRKLMFTKFRILQITQLANVNMRNKAHPL